MKLFRKFRQDKKGATAIEYGLIAALVSVVIITGLQLLGGSLSGAFTEIGETINTTVTDADS